MLDVPQVLRASHIVGWVDDKANSLAIALPAK